VEAGDDQEMARKRTNRGKRPVITKKEKYNAELAELLMEASRAAITDFNLGMKQFVKKSRPKKK
jgi:hypothetical protein